MQESNIEEKLVSRELSCERKTKETRRQGMAADCWEVVGLSCGGGDISGLLCIG